MARIVFELQIDSAGRPIVEALTTADGIKAWWTDDVTVNDATMQLGFPVAPKPFELRIESVADDKVVWRSVGDFPPHWVNTTVIWTLASEGDSTTVRFAHDGWATDEGPLPAAAYTWGQLLARLKQHAESGALVPLFVR